MAGADLARRQGQESAVSSVYDGLDIPRPPFRVLEGLCRSGPRYLRKPPRLTLQMNGIYYDDPEYQSNPGTQDNGGKTLDDFLVEGSLITGSPVRQVADDSTSPFATSSTGVIEFEFTAGLTGTYFFGVGSMKAITRNQTHTGTYEVLVTTTSD